MKIVHVCLEAPYIDGWLYQENLLPRHHAELGHDVTVIGSRNILPAYLRGKVDYSHRTEPYKDGLVQILRIKSSFSLIRHLNYYRSLYSLLERLRPDLIFHHGGQSLSLIDSKRYVDNNKEARLFVDFHAESYNSAKSWGSKVVLHKLIWKWVIQHCLSSISQIYCISPSTKQFCEQLYSIPSERMKYLYLGLEPLILSPDERVTVRQSVRAELGISPSDFLLVTGGKLNPDKRIELIVKALDLLNCESLHLIVFGAADPSHQGALEGLLESVPRVHYMKWCDAQTIDRYFLASDLAVFPGGQSVLWQQSIAAGLPGIYRKWAGHEHLDQGNCRYLFSDVPEELAQWLRVLIDPENSRIIDEMRRNALILTQGEMSYRNEAIQIIARYNECLAETGDIP